MSDEETVEHVARKQPNILITGTPGTGKTTTAELVGMACGLKHVNIGQLVKEKGFHEGFDEEFQAYYVNEDAVVDELESVMREGGVVVDHHTCDFFPERWFDLVVVLRTENSILYPRLEARGYSEKKIMENVQCEIMQVVLDEAHESYKREIVVELKSESVEDMDLNVERIQQWIDSFISSHSNEE